MTFRILLFTLISFLFAFPSHAQNRNPYGSIGKKGKVVTLTQGRYEESFDDDSIQQIGTALVNVRTMQIVKLELTKDEQRVIDETAVSRFLSVDPLTKSYPMLTPYQFASNTPIIAIDVDGLEGEWVFKTIMDSRDGIEKRQGSAAAREFDKGIQTGALLTAVAVVDIYVTRGWISNMVMGSQLLGAFEHNRAKTPEGRVAQDKRTGESLANGLFGLMLGGVASKLAGTFISTKESIPLFRGTTEGYEGAPALQETGITPTSKDPAAAVMFATQAKDYGNAVIYISDTHTFSDVGVTANVLKDIEAEVAVNVSPAQFMKRSQGYITLPEAKGILNDMGIKIPQRVTLENMNSVLENTPKMTKEQITDFTKKANEIIKSRTKTTN